MKERLLDTRTRIVATLGPASSTVEGITGLVEAGADVLRLNLSHGTPEAHVETIRRIREVERDLARPLAIMADLPGPKLRLHAEECTAEVDSGGEVEIRIHPDSDRGLVVDRPEAISRLQPGHRVLIDDGLIRLLVVEVEETHARCSVLAGGCLRPRVGVNLPDTEMPIPAVDEEDLALAELMADQEVDYVAVSFCRDGDDLRNLRRHLAERGTGAVHLVAKVERPVAVECIDDIVKAADAILVARGDLGVEMDVARVPLVQKQIVQASRRLGRPVIVATQMLQSMIEAKVPTRAEASDVANAILDGADAVMLSGETAVGHHPQLVVETMHRIIDATEQFQEPLAMTGIELAGLAHQPSWMPALASGAWKIVEDLQPRFMAIWTSTGEAARMLSRSVLPAPLIAFTEDVRVARRMQMMRGVCGVVVDRPESRDDFPGVVEHFLRDACEGRTGDLCLVLSGPGFDQEDAIDSISILKVNGGIS